jgi:hypothetical protein
MRFIFDREISENCGSFAAMSLDSPRNGVRAVRSASVDRNSNTLCSKGSRDRLSQADAATCD